MTREGTAPLYITAKQAAAELNVSLPTLYAYVSRGMIQSEPRAGHRSRLYRAADVRALTRRKEPAGQTGSEARGALDWGLPVLESAITLIDDDALYYRGRDVARLATGSSLEAVAGLIWQAEEDDPFAAPAPEADWARPVRRAGRGGTGQRPVARCLALLPLAAEIDLEAFNHTPVGVSRTGARILRWMAAAIGDAEPTSRPLHLTLAAAWGLEAKSAGADLIRAALVLCADHELNASTFAARCVASTGASPYAAVLAGLAALGGPRHGGLSEQAEAALPGLLAADDPHTAVAERLRRGEGLPGFGHPLYPHGDPRAAILLRLMTEAFPDDRRIARARDLAAAARALAGRPPSIDFALALLGHLLALPAGAVLAIFAVGRSVGWVGHVMEQYAGGRLIRPRARYTGILP